MKNIQLRAFVCVCVCARVCVCVVLSRCGVTRVQHSVFNPILSCLLVSSIIAMCKYLCLSELLLFVVIHLQL